MLLRKLYIKGAISTSQSQTGITGTGNVSDIRAIDFDGDGQLEVLTLSSDGYGKFTNIQGQAFLNIYGSTSTFFGKPADFFTGDFNGDGKTDYISYSSSSGWQLYYSTRQHRGKQRFYCRLHALFIQFIRTRRHQTTVH